MNSKLRNPKKTYANLVRNGDTVKGQHIKRKTEGQTKVQVTETKDGYSHQIRGYRPPETNVLNKGLAKGERKSEAKNVKHQSEYTEIRPGTLDNPDRSLHESRG